VPSSVMSGCGRLLLTTCMTGRWKVWHKPTAIARGMAAYAGGWLVAECLQDALGDCGDDELLSAVHSAGGINSC
jgi:hypothetical protein